MSNIENLIKRLIVLSIFGVAVSAYLVYHHENVVGGYNIGQSFCNISAKFNCDDVTKSKYATLFGIPFACIGLFYFLSLSSFLVFNKKSEDHQLVAYVGLSSLLAFIPSVVLFLISAFEIKKFCLFCILLDLIIACIVLLTLRFVNFANLFPATAFIRKNKIQFYLISPLLIVFCAFLPWAYRNFILEASLKESVIIKLYEEWSSSPIVELNIDSGTDLMLRDFSIGPDDAKVVLVEFSDFQCPFCQLASKEVKNLAKRWPNDLKIVFKNFALDKLCNLQFQQAPHELACQAAVMARCAGMQGEAKFWQFHDQLFSLVHEEWSLENLLKLSAPYGSEQIKSCIEKGLALERVRADSELGNQVGINSTPSFYINGRRAKFNRLDQIEKLIELILKKSSK